MADETPHPLEPASPARSVTVEQHLSWLWAQILCLLMLSGLGWLLARLVWLYYFFGLFFFLVAGLLVGAVAFRVARRARPIEKGRLLRGIVATSICSSLITVVWEFRHFSDTVGQPPRFSDARNSAIAAGRLPREVREQASEQFKKYLAEKYPPGGAAGYVRWAFRAGDVKLTVEATTETIFIDHRHWVWPVRTIVGAFLLAAGLWFSLESLRFAYPVTNVLQPGEEIAEE